MLCAYNSVCVSVFIRMYIAYICVYGYVRKSVCVCVCVCACVCVCVCVFSRRYVCAYSYLAKVFMILV